MTPAPPNIGLIVFDLGKVLVDFDYRIATRHLSQLARLGPDEILELLLRTSLLLEYERGDLSSAQFYAALVRQIGLQTSYTEFADRFSDIFSPITPMLELLDHIQAAGRPTALLSNTNELAVQHIRARFPFFDRFTHRVLSFEHGAMKPDPRLYRVLENISGFSSDRILFLDDRPENVEAARHLGWHTFVHLDPESTLARFAQLGLVPHS